MKIQMSLGASAGKTSAEISEESEFEPQMNPDGR
jgi:hypothetical protein